MPAAVWSHTARSAFRRAILSAACALLSACATHPSEQYSFKDYAGPERPPADIAVVELKYDGKVRIDGRHLVSRDDYGRLELLPGEHRIAWKCACSDCVRSEVTVRLEAGHRYTLHCYNQREGYRSVPWITDDTAAPVEAGSNKP